ncbi:hypothetical protein ACP70R_009985 [Stipagrostis hirtigluma subsp. patula]
MAARLAVQALSASLSRAETSKPSTPPRTRPAAAAATTSRRLAMAAAAVVGTALLASTRGTGALDLRITVPEQSSEEAEAVVRTHARNLVRVKQFIDARSWRELQAALRAAASNLKLDLYAIIQASPASRRPELRGLYSKLFNSVTSLDYAARDKDELQVQEHYGSMVSTLDDIMSKIM